MSTATASTELAMPRERAWRILQDLSVAHRYVPGLVRTEIRTAQTTGVGASRRVYRKGERGLDETVVEWEDGHGFLLRLTQPDGSAPAPFARASFRYWLDDVPGQPERSRMTITLEYEPRWGATGRLLDRLLLAGSVAKMQQQLARRIKAFYESA